MPRSGLSKRLQQQSRRSGFAVGISMVVAIAICFAAFTWIYVQLEPWVQDFAGAEDAPPTATARPSAENRDNQEDEGDEPEPTQAPESEPEDEDEAPIEERTADGDEGDDAEAFEPDFVLVTGGGVNFRTVPQSGDGSTIIDTLETGTRLQSTGETAPADTADNGPWRQFRLEDGTEGWLREVDVSQT